MPTFDYRCINDDCDAEIEFEVEPESAGSFHEPPSGGWAYPIEETCPTCKRDLHVETYLDRVYAAWCDDQEPDFS